MSNFFRDYKQGGTAEHPTTKGEAMIDHIARHVTKANSLILIAAAFTPGLLSDTEKMFTAGLEPINRKRALDVITKDSDIKTREMWRDRIRFSLKEEGTDLAISGGDIFGEIRCVPFRISGSDLRPLCGICMPLRLVGGTVTCHVGDGGDGYCVLHEC